MTTELTGRQKQVLDLITQFVEERGWPPSRREIARRLGVIYGTVQDHLAAKQLAASGVELHAGETVRYVIAAAKDKVKEWRTQPLALQEGPLDYDPAKYLEFLERATDEILDGV